MAGKARIVLAAAMVAAVMAGCGGGDADGTDAASNSDGDDSAVEETTVEPITIKTRMKLTPQKTIVSSGKIVEGSTAGDAPFCPGGTITDKHGAVPGTVSH